MNFKRSVVSFVISIAIISIALVCLLLFVLHREFIDGMAKHLGESGPTASWSTPLLIGLLEKGPNDYDTGDGPLLCHSDVALALGQVGDEKVVDPLIKAMQTERFEDSLFGRKRLSNPIDWAAVEALGLLGPRAQKAVPYLIELFNREKNSGYASCILVTLGKIGDPQAVPVLTQALAYPNYVVCAANALALFGPKAQSAAATITDLYNANPDQPGSASIFVAIREINGKEAAIALRPSYERQLGRVAILLMRTCHCAIEQTLEKEIIGTLPSGMKIHIVLDKEVWIKHQRFLASVAIEREAIRQPKKKYFSLDELKEGLLQICSLQK